MYTILDTQNQEALIRKTNSLSLIIPTLHQYMQHTF